MTVRSEVQDRIEWWMVGRQFKKATSQELNGKSGGEAEEITRQG